MSRCHLSAPHLASGSCRLPCWLPCWLPLLLLPTAGLGLCSIAGLGSVGSGSSIPASMSDSEIANASGGGMGGARAAGSLSVASSSSELAVIRSSLLKCT